MYSMTGYGRGEAEVNGRTLVVELKSVNHRFLDLSIKLPRVLLFAEDAMKKTILVPRRRPARPACCQALAIVPG